MSTRRRSGQFWSQAKRWMVQFSLFFIVLGLGSTLAQVSADKGNAGFGGSLGAPDGTNGIYMPRLIYSPNPAYTDAARRKRIQGLVLIALIVNPDGTRSELRVLQGLDPDLDKEAVKTVSRWKYKPGTKEGRPVAMHIAVEVNFRLDRP
jgi:periplasmic protein TonB